MVVADDLVSDKRGTARERNSNDRRADMPDVHRFRDVR
jgi:hypothetical protein